jgi:hypothetical protein
MMPDLKRTVTTTVAATGTAPEMIGRREYHHSVFDIGVFLIANQGRIFEFIPDFAQDRDGAIQFLGEPCHRLETKTTQASRLQTLCGQSADDLARDSDLLTPARSLVKIAFGQAASVVPAAHRASFVLPQILRFFNHGL